MGTEADIIAYSTSRDFGLRASGENTPLPLIFWRGVGSVADGRVRSQSGPNCLSRGYLSRSDLRPSAFRLRRPLARVQR
jgi:hypothetical protein